MKKIIFIICLMAVLFPVLPAMAQTKCGVDKSGNDVICSENQKCCKKADSSYGACIAEDEVCLNIPVGGKKEVKNISELITVWYGFVIGMVGILATVMIMWGGFKWLTSRGNPTVIGEAKEYIWSAVIGLFLTFFSYTILYIINPNIVNKIGIGDLPGISALLQEEKKVVVEKYKFDEKEYFFGMSMYIIQKESLEKILAGNFNPNDVNPFFKLFGSPDQNNQNQAQIASGIEEFYGSLRKKASDSEQIFPIPAKFASLSSLSSQISPQQQPLVDEFNQYLTNTGLTNLKDPILEGPPTVNLNPQPQTSSEFKFRIVSEVHRGIRFSAILIDNKARPIEIIE